MSEIIETNIEEQEEELVVRSDIEAGWQLKRRKELIADRDNLIAFYQARIDAVKKDADVKLSIIDRALFLFFQTVQHHKTATQESYTHPEGKLVLKKQEPEFKRDDKAVMSWLKDNNGGNYIKTTESLDWASLKKDVTVMGNNVVTSDGEIVPGVEVIEREAKFTVE